jgi:hypothetical protein
MCCGLDPAGPDYDAVGISFEYGDIKMDLKYTGKLRYRLDPPGPGYDPVGSVRNTAMNLRPPHKMTNCFTSWSKIRCSRTELAIN